MVLQIAEEIFVGLYKTFKELSYIIFREPVAFNTLLLIRNVTSSIATAHRVVQVECSFFSLCESVSLSLEVVL